MGDEKSLSGQHLSQEIDKSAKMVSVGALKKKGFDKVRVLRPSDIKNMIIKAVDHAIARESRTIAEAERGKYVEASKAELKKLMAQWTESAKRQQELELSRDGLQKRMEELHRTIDLQRDEIQRLEKDARAKDPDAQSKAIEAAEKERLQFEAQNKVLNTALEQVTESNRRMKDELEEARKGGGGGGGGNIEGLLVAMFQEMRESKKESSGVKEIGEHIGKMADKLTEAISSKLSAGGGPPMTAAATAQFKEVVLDKLFSGESAILESNIANVKPKEKKAGGVGGALKKLKSLQKGGSDE
ncbi:MAG: hypothetical protein O7H41_12675 [Planctomycetota bacterium]|nr:hypothetical protein [Planctomycetota bacterium]